MNSKYKLIIQKLANVVTQQQKVIVKLAQQVVDTSHPTTDPLGKLIHDAVTTWATNNRMSARSSFNAGLQGKNYDVEVILEITDPKVVSIKNSLNAQRTKETLKQNFLTILQSIFNTASQNSLSPLVGYTANFDVKVR